MTEIQCFTVKAQYELILWPLMNDLMISFITSKFTKCKHKYYSM